MSSKSKRKKPKHQIYIGPTIPGTPLERYKVFRGDLHGSIDDVCEKVPAVKRLIVDVNKLAENERKLSDKTSVQASSYAEVIKHIKGVKS